MQLCSFKRIPIEPSKDAQFLSLHIPSGHTLLLNFAPLACDVSWLPRRTFVHNNFVYFICEKKKKLITSGILWVATMPQQRVLALRHKKPTCYQTYIHTIALLQNTVQQKRLTFGLPATQWGGHLFECVRVWQTFCCTKLLWNSYPEFPKRTVRD